MEIDKTNESVSSIDVKLNLRTEQHQFTHYFPSVNRFDPRSNFFRPYIEKEFPQYPVNMEGIRDVPVESTLYGIRQQIGKDCNYILDVTPTTTLGTQMGTEHGQEQKQSDSYWLSQFRAVKDVQIQQFKINENTHALNNDNQLFDK